MADKEQDDVRVLATAVQLLIKLCEAQRQMAVRALNVSSALLHAVATERPDLVRIYRGRLDELTRESAVDNESAFGLTTPQVLAALDREAKRVAKVLAPPQGLRQKDRLARSKG